jgi:lipoate-protein ligase A
MTAPLRLIDTGLASARRNIAVTAALAELHGKGQIVDTLRLCRYARSVLIGQSQTLAAVADLDACRARNVEVARRVTGGGAVYMSPGVLVWEVVAGRHRFGGGLDDIAARISSGVAAGLARLGVAARFRPPGDVTVDGRKVGGSSGSIAGHTIVQQGTILVTFDAGEMAAVLGLPDPAAVAQRLTSLAECLGRAPPLADVKAALLEGLARHWDCAFAPAAMTPGEKERTRRLLAETRNEGAVAEPESSKLAWGGRRA